MFWLKLELGIHWLELGKITELGTNTVTKMDQCLCVCEVMTAFCPRKVSGKLTEEP